MEHSGEFSCPDCNMVFRSSGLLDKHKSRFCIGSAIGDPAVLRRGRVEIIEPGKVDLRVLRPTKTKTPDLIHVSKTVMVFELYVYEYMVLVQAYLY